VLLGDDEDGLYHGINVAEIALEILGWAETKKINNASVDALLSRMRHFIMPKLMGVLEEELEFMPDSFEKARKLVKPLMTAYQEVHFCGRGCMRFKNYPPLTKRTKKDLLEVCTKCGLSRFNDYKCPRYKSFIFYYF
jgi:hypothetical protein